MAYFSPYIPSHLKAALDDSKSTVSNLENLRNYSGNFSITSSYFRYDPDGYPLKNTQQLNVDWSKFENHVFFSSAETKVGSSFDQIINNYPFDGTKEEVENFLNKITGYEKWILEKFPKYRGQLKFDNSWIEVKDAKGVSVGSLSREETGEDVLTPPENSSMSLEFLIFLPQEATGQQVICQKIDELENGFGIYIDHDVSSTQSMLHFLIKSGSHSLHANAILEKNIFSHVTSIFNKESDSNYLEIFVNEVSVAKSNLISKIKNLNSTKGKSLFIGTGTKVKINGSDFIPTSTLQATLDEFRFFHSIRTKKQQQLFAKKSIFATDDLKLYYKFNEPRLETGNTIDSIVLDSSGNSLHSFITNFSILLRENSALDEKNPMIYEKEMMCPILFPSHPQVIDLVSQLITSASLYDRENPNLIIKLIPRHYLEEGADQEASLMPSNADDFSSYGGSEYTEEGKVKSSQIIISFLYIWSKFFDEIKLYLDSFSNLNFVDYDKHNTAPDTFLSGMVKKMGFYLPKLFKDGTIEQYIDAENINDVISSSEISLKEIQSEITRRVLINLPDVIRSKGTKHSIKSFLRACGIDPENSFKIKEFGGPSKIKLTNARENRIEPGHMLKIPSTGLVLSPFLSGTRVEPGYPFIQGQFDSSGISNSKDDGLFTSGSWCVEAIYKWPPSSLNDENGNEINILTQSLSRICAGEFSVNHPWDDSNELEECNFITNLIAIKENKNTILKLHIRPGDAEDSPIGLIELNLPPESLFDGEKWSVAYGCLRNDSIDSVVSSSYFLKVGKSSNGNLVDFHSKNIFFNEKKENENNVFRHKKTNNSQLFLAVGPNQIINSTSYIHLGYNVMTQADAIETSFDGFISHLRMWSKGISDNEFKEHCRNHRSTGVENPLLNYNFVNEESGSFEKIRFSCIEKQENKFADDLGQITFLDFSLNESHMFGWGFDPDSRALKGEIFEYSHLSSKIDEVSAEEKIRIRSFLDQKNVENSDWAMPGPVFELNPSEKPVDDTRLSLEFSLVDVLNRDIVTMLSSFEFIENAIGSPELLYSPDYPDLEKLREIYFKKIKEKINFQIFFEFFRWFETSIGGFIEQLVPRKTQFKGTNFVIESHLLERNKVEYQLPEIYLMESDRNRIRDVLLLQQLSGQFHRY